MVRRNNISFIFLFLIALLYNSGNWLIKTFGNIGFDQYLFHLLGPKDEANVDIFYQYFNECFVKVLIITMFFICLYLLFYFIFKDLEISLHLKICKIRFHFRLTIFEFIIKHIFAISFLGLIIMGYHFCNKIGIIEYFQNKANFSTIYEEYYVNPKDKITWGAEKRNLIILYVESLENTYALIPSSDGSTKNYIPQLTSLAEENIYFSNTEGIGGAYAAPGTVWTTSGLTSTTSGINLMVPINYNTTNIYDKFLPNSITLGDVLEEAGYRQVLLIGSDADFGNRSTYFRLHGNYEIEDYKYAINNNKIPEDYYVWWGYEDSKLFEFAKDKLLELSIGDEPFNLTLLTTDTHFVGGYLEEGCPAYYEDQFKNVLLCSSNMIYEFVRWIQQQDFYDDTTIVITGDHLTMDNNWITENADMTIERTIFQTFINASVTTDNTKNRLFNSMDLYPTILASIGANIEGEQLGLGVNLFSNKPTLSELLGKEYILTQLQKTSRFYNEKFIFSN